MRSILSCMLSAKRFNVCQVLLPPGFVKRSEFRDEYRDSLVVMTLNSCWRRCMHVFLRLFFGNFPQASDGDEHASLPRNAFAVFNQAGNAQRMVSMHFAMMSTAVLRWMNFPCRNRFSFMCAIQLPATFNFDNKAPQRFSPSTRPSDLRLTFIHHHSQQAGARFKNFATTLPPCMLVPVGYPYRPMRWSYSATQTVRLYSALWTLNSAPAHKRTHQRTYAHTREQAASARRGTRTEQCRTGSGGGVLNPTRTDTFRTPPSSCSIRVFEWRSLKKKTPLDAYREPRETCAICKGFLNLPPAHPGPAHSYVSYYLIERSCPVCRQTQKQIISISRRPNSMCLPRKFISQR